MTMMWSFCLLFSLGPCGYFCGLFIVPTAKSQQLAPPKAGGTKSEEEDGKRSRLSERVCVRASASVCLYY